MEETILIDSVSKNPVKVGDTIEFRAGTLKGEHTTLLGMKKVDNRVFVTVKVLGQERDYASFVLGLEELPPNYE